MSRTTGQWAAVAAVLIIFLGPFHPFLTGTMPEIIYNALAADTYYYAALARNFTLHGFFGIDGQTASNGYMPLWQMIVAALDRVFAGPETPPSQLLSIIFLASTALIAFGVAGLVLFVARRYGPGFALLTVPLICPGAAFWLLQHAYVEFLPDGLHSGHSMWSFANGMESGVGLALFAIFVPVAFRALDPAMATPRAAFLAGALAFLIMMSRLDDIFLGIAFGLCLLALSIRIKKDRLFLYMTIVPLIGTFFYVALNTVSAGSALPTSGMLKTQFFSFPNRWMEFSAIGNVQTLDGRMLPLTAAVVFGFLGLMSQLRSTSRTPSTPLILMLSIYLLLKAGFLISSVPAFNQGYWYYTNMIAAMNLLVVIALSRILSLSTQSRIVGVPVALAAAVIAALNAGGQLQRYTDESYATVAKALCTEPENVARLLPPDTGIIDTGDGVYAFCLGRPAVTLTGLADSREFINQRYTVGFLPAAIEHGHSILIESPVRWASYPWRNFLGDEVSAKLLGAVGQINVWRLSPQ